VKVRFAVAATVLVLVLAGTLWGQDDDFPFGPFRMYATAAKPTGNVRTAELWGVRADGARVKLEAHDVGLRRAVLIGVSQILALMPGVSRSGITITTGRFSRLTRDAAARFSFLLLIPIVLGAVVYKGAKVAVHPLPAGSTGPFIVGTLAAVAVGLVAIDLLLGYVRRYDYTPFVVYRIVLAIFIAVVILTGWRGATF